jgi:membrane-associated phospholipid phosphatase
METVLQQGIEFIVWLQQYQTAGLNAFFSYFTNFGGSYYLYMVPLVVWCVDYRMGSRLVVLFILTLFINSVLKDWIAQPRPFQMDERIISSGEHGYGLPSGHAQLVVVFWGLIAAWLSNKWFWAIAIVIMFLMGFSRVYLGVHFPSDVIAGWLLGALTLALCLRFGDSLDAWLRQLAPARQVLLLVVTSVLMTLPGSGGIEASLVVAAGGFFLGAGLGMVLANHSAMPFDGRGVWWRRVLRYVLGVAGTLALIAVLQKNYPGGKEISSMMILYAMLALLGFWVSFIAPRLFCLIGLAGNRGRVETSV